MVHQVSRIHYNTLNTFIIFLVVAPVSDRLTDISYNGIQLLQYNLVGTLGSQPGVSSVSCQSYNKRSNWLTISSLGRKVRF